MQKRRSARCVPKTAIGVQFLLDGYVVAYGDVLDISLGGAGLTTGEGLISGHNLELRFAAEDPALPAFQTAAKVVWCEPGNAPGQQTRCGVRWPLAQASRRHPLQTLIESTCAVQPGSDQ
jgi:hypothetical protein